MDREENMYRDSLLNLCVYTAEIQRFADRIQAGLPVNKRQLVYASSMATRYKQFFLQDKKAMGFEDGLDFMEDNKFIGFEVKSGRLVGDPEQIIPVCQKWIDGFPESSNHYQYEVSMYCLALAYGQRKNNLYPDLSDEALWPPIAA